MSGLSLIVAMDKNGLIGKDNSLPWSLPADLKYFRETTSGHPVVMGRKTFESIGRPLPNRLNIILTRTPAFQAEGCTVISSVDKVLEQSQSEEVFIIGGKQVYHLFLPFVQRVYLTRIDEEFEGDTHLQLDLSDFKLVKETFGVKDVKNPHPHRYQLFERN